MPTLTTSSNNTSDEDGLYVSTATNSGEPTYYFRGNVGNNYVSFAGQIWRIVRINEDRTIRIIMQDGINNNTEYAFNSNYDNFIYMYYSNSDAKAIIEDWYQTNIGSKSNFASKVASGNYFCEQAAAKHSLGYRSGNTNMEVYSNYTPNFRCTNDGNNKGLLNTSIGLITYDEVVYAGGYYHQQNNSYYLNSNKYFWTMSSAGFSGFSSSIWLVNSTGFVYDDNVHGFSHLRVVLNLKAGTLVTGTGTSSDPYVIQS